MIMVLIYLVVQYLFATTARLDIRYQKRQKPRGPYDLYICVPARKNLSQETIKPGQYVVHGQSPPPPPPSSSVATGFVNVI